MSFFGVLKKLYPEFSPGEEPAYHADRRIRGRAINVIIV